MSQTGKEEFDEGVEQFKSTVRKNHAYGVGEDYSSKKNRLKIRGSASAKNLLGRMSNARHEETVKQAMNKALEKRKNSSASFKVAKKDLNERGGFNFQRPASEVFKKALKK